MLDESNNIVNQENIDDESTEELDITEAITLSVQSDGAQQTSDNRGHNERQADTNILRTIVEAL